jgi:predicted amidohydrolase
MKIIVRVGACQTPEIIGDPPTALAIMLQFAKEAEDKKVDLLLFPECFLSGYILDETYMANYAYDFESNQFAAIINQLVNVKPVLVFGVSEKKSGKYFNSAVVVNRGEIIGVYRKTHLIDPNEAFFTPGKDYPIFEIKGLKYGINICYDAQFTDAAKAVADQGAQLLLLPAQNMIRRENAEKWKHKHSEIGAKRVRETGLWYVRSDVTGIRPPDQYGIERIAYGPTQAMNPKAEVVAQVPLMTVGLITVDIPVVSHGQLSVRA